MLDLAPVRSPLAPIPRVLGSNGGPIYDENWGGVSDNCPSVQRPGMTGPNGREPYRSTCLDFGGAASNHPLKGGKFSNFEGGVVRQLCALYNAAYMYLLRSACHRARSSVEPHHQTNTAA